jgi:hypothetical protein
MKKWIFGVLFFALLLLASLYIFIPNVVTLKSNIGIKVTQQGLYRMLLDTNNVQKWWPGNESKNTDGNKFLLNGYYYKIYANNISLAPVTITNSETDLKTSLYIISLETDSVKLAWVGSMVTSYNPVKRFFAWQKAKKINGDMNSILQKMQFFYSVNENIYGIKVEKALVTDSVLISTGANSKGYPDTKFIYTLINKLRAHAAANNVKETGFPMLNVDTKDSITFNVRVALPISKALPNTGDIAQKRMLADGNILVAEVKGGVATTTAAFEQIIKYSLDYQRVAPAIPFFSLITDRTKEPDSSKWITKVYCPVM